MAFGCRMACAVLCMICGTAFADVYDDFNNQGIESNKWEVVGTGFVQPGDGWLHFLAKSGEGHSLISKERYSSGVFTLSFKDYRCDNDAPSGKGLGSIAGLGLGSRSLNNWVRIERGQIKGGGYVEVNWVSPEEPGHPIHVNWFPWEVVDGFLQIRYDGTTAAFFYRAKESDPWIQMFETDREGRTALKPRPLVLKPNWVAKVPVYITAFPGGRASDRYSLSFKVDRIDIEIPIK